MWIDEGCGRYHRSRLCYPSDLTDAEWDLVRPHARPGLGQTPEALADVARIDALWTTTRERFGAGWPYLFGADFGNADAMYAPVVARLLTYAPPLSPMARAYREAVRAHPLVAELCDAAAREPEAWFISGY